MIAVASNIKQIIEIRRFAKNMEHVLYIEYQGKKIAGRHITEQEAKKYDLVLQDDYYEDL